MRQENENINKIIPANEKRGKSLTNQISEGDNKSNEWV